MDAEQIAEGRARWQARYDAARKSERDYTTLSGTEVDPLYGPTGADDRMERIGWPGEYPFTRGIHPTGYRGKPWTIRQFAGFGNAKQTNERYKMILAEGGGGLSVAFDMPTLMGRDSDDARALGEVGHCGVAIDSAADMDVLFEGIDLAHHHVDDDLGPAVPVFCMYVVAAERQGADTSKLNGTLQTDIFKEYIAQKEWIYPPEPHLKLIGDLMEYVAHDIPAYKPLSVSGYHIREAGATAVQELAFTLADGFGYVELGLSAAWTSSSSRRACRSSSTRTSTSSRRSPSCARPGGSGRAGCATSTARRPTRRCRCGSTPRPRASRSPRSSPTTTSSARPSRRWRRSWRARTRCTPTPWTRCWRCRRRSRPRSRCAPSRSSPRRPACSTSPTRSAARGTSRRSPTRWKPRPRRSSRGSRRSGRRRHDHLRPAARHRGRLVHRRDRRLRLRVPGGAGEGRQARRRRQHPHRRRRRRWRSCGCRTRSSSRSGPWSSSDARPATRARSTRPWRRMVAAAEADENTVPAMLDAARAEATLGEICNAFKPIWGEYREAACASKPPGVRT